MDEIAKVILFFLRTEALAILMYMALLINEMIHPDSAKSALRVKVDISILWGLTMCAVLATCIYSWWI